MTEHTALRIPLLDLAPDAVFLHDELHAAFDRVLSSGQFILGQEVEAFEAEIAADLGVKHAIGVNSGTDALVIALRAMNIGPGDEVITSPFTFVASAEAVSIVGATPVFADIEPTTFNIAPAAIEAAVTPRTRAIIPVHLFGLAADMTAIQDIATRHRLRVLEDVAQAMGGRHEDRPLGTIGDAGAFSFFPSKNLGAFGDGGMIATNCDDLASQSRMLRTHGSRRKYYNEVCGYNSRLDALQAAILRVKRPHLPAWNDARRKAATLYAEHLADIPGITLPAVQANVHHVYHQYTIRVDDCETPGISHRNQMHQHLASHGIGTAVYYPVPLHQLPLYTNGAAPACPVSEQAARDVLSLPMGPHLDATSIRQVADAIRRAMPE